MQGLNLPSINLVNLIAGIIFSSIGFIAFIYGKKQKEFKPMAIGIGLMAYPYFITNTIAIIVIGVALTGALFIEF